MEKSKIDLSRKQELCLKCRACCKIFGVPSMFNPGIPEVEEYYRARGCAVVTLEGPDTIPREISMVVVPIPCPHLKEEGCNIYENRPYWCKIYDGRKDPLVRDRCLWEEEE